MNDTNFQIFSENIKNKVAIENLYDDVFGKNRKDRTVYFLRTGKKINDLCFVIKKNTDYIYACIQFWQIKVGLQSGLLLGPLAVRNEFRGYGLGSMLIKHSLGMAKVKNFNFCFVSGEEDYYPRFGFQKIDANKLILPGYIDPKRLHIIFLNNKIVNKMGEYPWKIKPQN